MLKKIIILNILTYLLIANICFAQQTLTNATKIYRENTRFELDINLSVAQKSSVNLSQKGVLRVSGDKYMIDVKNDLIFCDGVNTYNYSRKNKEIVIEKVSTSSPLYSPRKVLAIDSKAFRVIDSNIKKDTEFFTLINNGTSEEHNVNKIYVEIEKGFLTKIVIEDFSQNLITIQVLKSNFNPTFNDNIFEFNKKNYKGVEIIDFR